MKNENADENSKLTRIIFAAADRIVNALHEVKDEVKALKEELKKLNDKHKMS